LVRERSRVQSSLAAPEKPKQFQALSARGTKPRERSDTERNAKTPLKNGQIREKAGKSVRGLFGAFNLRTGHRSHFVAIDLAHPSAKLLACLKRHFNNGRVPGQSHRMPL
jgi:hypothetical protein